MTDAEFDRRGFVKLTGAAALLPLGRGGVQAQQVSQESSDFSGAAVLIGPDANRPDPDGGFFKDKPRYHYLYVATDTGARYSIETGDSQWTKITVDNQAIKEWALDSVWAFYQFGGKVKAMAGTQQNVNGAGYRAGEVVYEGDRTVGTEVHRVIQEALDDVVDVTKDGDDIPRGGEIRWVPGEYVVAPNSDYTSTEGHVIQTKASPGSNTRDGNAEVVHHFANWDTAVKLADNSDPSGHFFVFIPSSTATTHWMGIIGGRILGNKSNQTVTDVNVVHWDPENNGTFREVFMHQTLVKQAPQDNVDIRNTGNARITWGAYEQAKRFGIIADSDTKIFGVLSKKNDNHNVRGGKAVYVSATGSTNGSGFGGPMDLIFASEANNNGDHGVDLNTTAYVHLSSCRNNTNAGIRAVRGNDPLMIEAWRVSGNGSQFSIEGSGVDPIIFIEGMPPARDLTGATPQHPRHPAFHDGTDGTNTNARGPAHANAAADAFISTVDGGTIS